MNQIISYTELCKMINDCGKSVDSEGGPVKEITGLQLFYSPGLLISRKNLNKRLAMLEALMFCAGMFDIERIKAVAPNANHDLYLWQSDYGPRTRLQIHSVIDHLKNFPNTRKAVIDFRSTIYPSVGYQENYYKDMACTTSMQFLLRGDSLNQIVTMRSCDIVYGFPMDIFMFGIVAQLVAMSLGNVKTISSCIQIGSAHIYEKTKDLAVEVDNPEFVSLTSRGDFEEIKNPLFRYSYIKGVLKSAMLDGALNDPATWLDYKNVCAWPFEFSQLKSSLQLEV